MSPKEKSEELIDKFVVKCIHRTQAKNCAIICVEQIIEANPYYFYPGRKVTRIEDHSTIDHWKEILEHLKNS
jgi:hypothetical protein